MDLPNNNLVGEFSAIDAAVVWQQLTTIEFLDLQGTSSLVITLLFPIQAEYSHEQLHFPAGNLLSGTIPPDLADVTSMIGLSMASNRLTGTVPSELFQLSTLANLNLVGPNFCAQSLSTMYEGSLP